MGKRNTKKLIKIANTVKDIIISDNDFISDVSEHIDVSTETIQSTIECLNKIEENTRLYTVKDMIRYDRDKKLKNLVKSDKFKQVVSFPNLYYDPINGYYIDTTYSDEGVDTPYSIYLGRNISIGIYKGGFTISTDTSDIKFVNDDNTYDIISYSDKPGNNKPHYSDISIKPSAYQMKIKFCDN